MTLKERSQICHTANKKWWQNIDTGEPIERNPFELLALAISEVSECLEGERKNLMDDKLPHRKMPEVEMADTYIRLLDFSAGFGYDLDQPIVYEYVFIVADNKGEALFHLMEIVVDIGSYVRKGMNPVICLRGAIKFIEAYCLKFGYDLEGAFQEKMKFNSTRIDHTHEARRIAGGKQF